MFAEGAKICLFVQGYLKMLEKAEAIGLEQLPETKERQNQNGGELFYSYFTPMQQEKIHTLLAMGRYIPQEILSIEDF